MLKHVELLLSRSPILAPDEVYYPESDGQPMGETGVHIAAILYLLQALRHFFRRTEQIYVGANMLFYYSEGDPTSYKVPDVFVVKGVPEHERRIYKLWTEGVPPSVIFEISSRSTRYEDTGDKKGLYETLGVREYFIFDPLNEYLKPRLQGFLLQRGSYQPIAPSGDGELISTELGLLLRAEGKLLRLVDPAAGRPLPTLDEAVDQIEIEARHAESEADRAAAEAERAVAEAQRAAHAEAELAQARAELEELRRLLDRD